MTPEFKITEDDIGRSALSKAIPEDDGPEWPAIEWLIHAQENGQFIATAFDPVSGEMEEAGFHPNGRSVWSSVNIRFELEAWTDAEKVDFDQLREWQAQRERAGDDADETHSNVSAGIVSTELATKCRELQERLGPVPDDGSMNLSQLVLYELLEAIRKAEEDRIRHATGIDIPPFGDVETPNIEVAVNRPIQSGKTQAAITHMMQSGIWTKEKAEAFARKSRIEPAGENSGKPNGVRKDSEGNQDGS